MKKRILLVTEDNAEALGINNFVAKIIYIFYLRVYKFIVERAVNNFQKNSEVLVLTNKIIMPDKNNLSKIIYFDEEWGNINWEAVRNESWEVARSWYNKIPGFKQKFTIDGIFLNDVTDIRIALHLSRSVISYKYFVKKYIDLFNPDLIVTVTLNSPPEMFSYLFSKEKSVTFKKINKINIFKINTYIRKFLWKLEERQIWEKVKSAYELEINENITNPDVLIVASHELHLKSAKPLIEKFEDKGIQVQVISDIQNLNQSFNNYNINIDCYLNLFKYQSEKILKNTYNQYKKMLLNDINKTTIDNLKYMDQYMMGYFKEKISQYIGFSAVYVKSASSLLRKVRPKTVIFISDRGALETSIAEISKKLKIPTFLISPNNIMSLDKTNEYKLADYVMVTGEYMKDGLIKLGMERKKISIVGDLRFDDLFKKQFDRKRITDKYKLDHNKKYILLISTYIATAVPYDDKKSAFQLISEGVKCLKGYKLLIKCHPNEKIDVLRSHVDKWGVEGDIVSGNLQEFLYISEAIAQTVSMSGFEAIIFNKPVLVINPKKTYEEYIPYIKNNAAIAINNKNDLIYYMEKLEKDNKFKEELLKSSKLFCEKFTGVVDGKVSQRIIDKIKKITNLKFS